MKTVFRLAAVWMVMLSLLCGCAGKQPEAAAQQVYTVRVVDAEGSPISGVMVQLCLDACYPGVTGADGKIDFPVEEAAYKVSLLTMPDGYTYSDEIQEFRFPDGSKSLTIVLRGSE
jgi:hypothetical protein